MNPKVQRNEPLSFWHTPVFAYATPRTRGGAPDCAAATASPRATARHTPQPIGFGGIAAVRADGMANAKGL